MIHVTFYTAEGRICRRKSLDDISEAGAFVPEGGGFYPDDVDPDYWYFVHGKMTERPQLSASDVYDVPADGETEIILHMPQRTSVECAGRGIIVGGEESLYYTTTIPGAHELTLTPPWPWRKKTVRVIAHAL